MKQGHSLPPCPITGKPAKRRVHGVSNDFLSRIWQFVGAGNVRHLLPSEAQTVLYESECGLYFFDSVKAGDSDFYTRFYGKHNLYALLDSSNSERSEFDLAAQQVPDNANVLDVGCGMGEFGRSIPNAVYRGLDPYAPTEAPDVVIRQSLDQHVVSHAGKYDVVSAFHVIEHTDTPLTFARQLLDLLRPGGVMIIAVPVHPSPLTEIPNLLINAPPHHLTWWNEGALRALADTLDLEIVECRKSLPCSHDAFIHRMNRLSFYKINPQSDNERYLAHRWLWHLNFAWSYLAARFATRWLPPITPDRSTSVMLVARRR